MMKAPRNAAGNQHQGLDAAYAEDAFRDRRKACKACEGERERALGFTSSAQGGSGRTGSSLKRALARAISAFTRVFDAPHGLSAFSVVVAALLRQRMANFPLPTDQSE